MSLLNQVLQDLESRERPPAQMSIRLAAESVSPYAVNDWQVSGWHERLRPGLIGMLVALLLVMTAWAFQMSWESSHTPAPSVATLLPAAQQSATETAAVVPPAAAVDKAMSGEPSVTNIEAHVVDGENETVDPVAMVQPAEQSVVADPTGEPDPAITPMPHGATVPPPTERQHADAGADAASPAPMPPPAFLPLRNVELPVGPARSTRNKSKGEVSVRPRALDSLAVARDAIASGELATAEKTLQRRLRGRPAERDARELLIGLLLRGERNEEALRQLETGLAYHPAHGNFILITAQLQATKGDIEAAIATLRRGAGIRAIRSQCLQMLGALLQQNGQYAAASESYRQLVSLEPRLANAWMGLAISLDAEGGTGAAPAYRRALEIGGLPEAMVAYARQRLAAME